MSTLRLHALPPSPNTRKVVLALGYKGLPYDSVPVEPGDRSRVIEASGQPLTPVLEHGDTIIFDSGAILRYLDANVKREPRLYSADYDEMKAIEKWEHWARTDLSPHVGGMFGQFFAPERSAKAITEACHGVTSAARHVNGALSPAGHLVGNSTTAADITAAAWFSLAFLTAEEAATHPILTFFRDNLKVQDDLPAFSRWYERVWSLGRGGGRS